MKNITYYSIILGVVTCLFGAIWSPQEAVKWVLSAGYIFGVGRLFGVTYRTEEVKGQVILRSGKELKNFLPMKGIKK